MPAPVVANVTPLLLGAEGLHHWFAGGTALALLLLLASGMERLRGTTLVAPCAWAALSVVCLGLVEFRTNMQGVVHSPGIAAMRFAAATATLCPLVAVLGAKRPQDRAWQWVVATLWLVLVSWPAGQAFISRSNFNLFIAWKLFLVGLVAIGPLNYLATRFWLASLFVVLGQMALISEFLWTVPPSALPWMQPLGLGCFLAASLTVLWQCRSKSSPHSEDSRSLTDFDTQWQQFRDVYGAFWGLRIMGRVNETAELRNWPMRLAWGGFAVGDAKEIEQPSPDQLEELQRTMSTLLRRYV